MADQDGLVYQCAPGIAWVRDGGQVLLVDGARDRAWRIDGLEATAWDLLTLRYSFERTAGTLAAVQNSSKEEAKTMLLATVRRWHTMGLLITAGENGRDEPAGH